MKSNNKKAVIGLIFMMLLSTICLADEEEMTKSDEYPTVCKDAIDLIIENLTEEDKKLLLSIKKEDLKNRRFVTGWGKGIRDGFGINEGNFTLMKSCQERRDNAKFHPIVVSVIIMEEVWQSLR